MVYTLHFFSSKCSLFHNSNVFGSCIIQILYTGCAKIKKKLFRRQKVNVVLCRWRKVLFLITQQIYLASILIIVQRDATQSSLFIILEVHSTCFGCQTQPIIRSTQNCNYSLRYRSYFFVQLPPSNVTKIVASRWTIIDIDQRCTEL